MSHPGSYQWTHTVAYKLHVVYSLLQANIRLIMNEENVFISSSFRVWQHTTSQYSPLRHPWCDSTQVQQTYQPLFYNVQSTCIFFVDKATKICSSSLISICCHGKNGYTFAYKTTICTVLRQGTTSVLLTFIWL